MDVWNGNRTPTPVLIVTVTEDNRVEVAAWVKKLGGGAFLSEGGVLWVQPGLGVSPGDCLIYDPGLAVLGRGKSLFVKATQEQARVRYEFRSLTEG